VESRAQLSLSWRPIEESDPRLAREGERRRAETQLAPQSSPSFGEEPSKMGGFHGGNLAIIGGALQSLRPTLKSLSFR
jgi:hypothetical protein